MVGSCEEDGGKTRACLRGGMDDLPEADSRRTALVHRSRVAEVVHRTARSRLGRAEVEERRSLVLEHRTVVGSLAGVDSHRRNSRQTC